MNQQYQYRPNFNYQRNSSNYLRQVSDDNNLYSSSEGFTLGNMFKDSYIPYKNYTPQVLTPTSEQDDLFLRLSEQEFAAHDLNLYLDTHPDDACAVNMYNSFTKQLNEAIRNYECKYGPLTNFGYGKSGCPWQWVEQPWPWDREFNC